MKNTLQISILTFGMLFQVISASSQQFSTVFPRLTPRPRNQTTSPPIILPSEISVHKNLNSNVGKHPFFLELANLHNQNSLLKMSFGGGNFTGPLERLDEILWRLPLTSKLQIFIDRSKKEHYTAYHVHWFGVTTNLDREVCFHIAHNNATWFTSITDKTGKPDWPMDRLKAISKGSGLVTGSYGSALEPLFLSSDGFAILLKHTSPWFIRREAASQDPLLCLSIDANLAPYSRHHKYDYMSLEFSIIASSSLRQAHQGLLGEKLLHKPTAIPPEVLFTKPIWSVVAENDKSVNQTSVIHFAEQIKKLNFPASQIDITGWEKYLGDGAFDTAKFPNPAKMMEDLQKLGYKSTFWVTPFIDSKSTAYSASVQYLTKSATSKGTKETKVKGGSFGIVDFSNASSVSWFTGRLKALQSATKLDSFKFDGGEVGDFGADHLFANRTVQELPNLITSQYVNACHSLTNGCDQVSSAFGTQAFPLFLQIKVPPTAEGLKSVIPTALSLSIGGYPFLVAQMANTPSEELYIRLLQATTFFPSMPTIAASSWLFNQSSPLTNLTRKYVNLHSEHSATFIALAKKVVQTGEPILRPLWYSSDKASSEQIATSDQYMVGEDLLVAPVLELGQRQRMVYFPTPGSSWIDQHGKIYPGGSKSIVQAPLEELPYFTRRQSGVY